MRLLEPDREADVYAISCELGLTRIGVAADARAPVQPILPGSAPGRLTPSRTRNAPRPHGGGWPASVYNLQRSLFWAVPKKTRP